MNTHWQAKVLVFHGNRKICNFMANAGLGVTGVGVKKVLVIDYKPGELVNQERVENAMREMVRLSDEAQSEIKVMSWEVLEVKEVSD